MKIVSDSSVIISLWRINHLHLLPRLFGEILIPPAVAAEISVHGKAGGTAFSQLVWLNVLALSDSNRMGELTYSLAGFQNLGRGEAEAIVLALDVQADALLIDERRGRSVSERAGLRITGVLGILLLAKNQEIITDIRPVLDELVLAGFRLNALLYQQMLIKAREL